MFIIFLSSIAGEINVFAVDILYAECVACFSDADVFNEACLMLKVWLPVESHAHGEIPRVATMLTFAEVSLSCFVSYKASL